MPWYYKFKKKKSRQPSPELVPLRIPSHVDTLPLNTGSTADTVFKGRLCSVGVENDKVVLTISTGVNDPGRSQIALPREDYGDDVTPGYPDGPLERDDDQETPSNVPDPKRLFPNILSEREQEVLNRHEHDVVVGQPTETPLAVSSDHVAGGAPDPVQPDKSEREQ